MHAFLEGVALLPVAGGDVEEGLAGGIVDRAAEGEGEEVIDEAAGVFGGREGVGRGAGGEVGERELDALALLVFRAGNGAEGAFDGEAVDLAVTHKGDAAWLTAFNLAGDGTVQMLFPLEGDGEGLLSAGHARVVMAKTRASPFL